MLETKPLTDLLQLVLAPAATASGLQEATPDIPHLAVTPTTLTEQGRKLLVDALTTLPPGKTGAFSLTGTLDGMAVVYVQKLDQHWTVAGRVGRPWHGGWDVEGTIVASW